jgi:hypothetical protein
MCTMDLQPSPASPSRRGNRCAALVLLVLLLFQASAAADTVRPVPALVRPSPVAAAPVLAWSLGRTWSVVETFLSNRARMVQMATIGMCIGLYILMRR